MKNDFLTNMMNNRKILHTMNHHKLYLILLFCMVHISCIMAENADTLDMPRKRYTWDEKWYYQVQFGPNYLAAENTRFVDFTKVLSTSHAFSVGKRFTPIWGARLQFMGGKDMGVYYAHRKDSPMFSLRHHGIIAEVTFNFAHFLRQNWYVGSEKKWNVDFKLGLGIVQSHSYDLSDEVPNDGSNEEFPDAMHRNNFAIYGGVEFSRVIYKNLDINFELSLIRFGNTYNGQVCRDRSSEVIGDMLAHALVGIRYTIPVKKPCKARIVYINNPVHSVIETIQPQYEEIEPAKISTDIATVDTIATSDCYEVEELLEMVKKGISIRGKRICSIEMVHFDFDKSIIKPEFAEYLDKLATLMLNQPDIKLLIMGHTDIKGSVEYNWGLSERRSKAVLDYLNNKGVVYSRMVYKYYSKLSPMTENTTNHGRSINRRVQFMILP